MEIANPNRNEMINEKETSDLFLRCLVTAKGQRNEVAWLAGAAQQQRLVPKGNTNPVSTDYSQASIKPILSIPTEFTYSTRIGYFACMPIGITWGKPMPLASAIQSLACLSCLCLRQTHEQSSALDFVMLIIEAKQTSFRQIWAFSPPLSWF